MKSKMGVEESGVWWAWLRLRMTESLARWPRRGHRLAGEGCVSSRWRLGGGGGSGWVSGWMEREHGGREEV